MDNIYFNNYGFNYSPYENILSRKKLGVKWKLLPQHNETSRNKSSFLQCLLLFWPVWQSRAAVEPNISLSQNNPSADIHLLYILPYSQMCIKRCFDQVTVFEFQVYSVNIMYPTLLYVMSLSFLSTNLNCLPAEILPEMVG